MEPIQFLPFNFITLLLFVSFTFLLIKGLMKSKPIKNKKFPPSPWKLPLIGNMHHLVGSASIHHVLREISKKYGPVMLLQLGEIPTIVISSREAAKNVLKVHDPACADRGESIGGKIMWYDCTNIFFAPYNDYWMQMRKLCIVELLSTKNVHSFSSIREEEAAHLLKRIESSCGKPLNLTKEISSFTSTIICKVAFGEVLKDKETLTMLVNEGLALARGLTLAEFFPSFKILQFMSSHKNRLWKMRSKLDVILDSLINEHRDNTSKNKRGNGVFGGEDIVDVLIRLQGSGEVDTPITNDNIKAIVFDMFTGATETSTAVVDWAMAEMMRNPHVMAKAQDEIRKTFKNGTFKESDIPTLKYLKLVIKETLRLHPPGTILPRACRKECEINGYIIPFKAKILVNTWALGRDPNYWSDAESFKPERFENSPIDFLGNNFEFLPFGAGKRICPGLNFGLASVEIPLAQLLYHFDWKLPEGMKPSEVDMSEAERNIVSRKNHLYLIPTPYNS